MPERPEVREQRAWTYSIGSSRRNLRCLYEFSIICNKFKSEALDEIEKVIDDCPASVSGREDLLEQTQRHILASNLMTDLSGRMLCNDALEDLAHNQQIISLIEDGNKIESVTMSDIRDLLQWLRPELRWTVIMRP